MFSLNGLFMFRFVTGDLSYIQTSNAIQYRPDAISTLLTGITATIVQTFLIYRYWRMSHNYYITTILILSMLAAWAGTVATAIALLKIPALNWMSKLQSCVRIWLITSVVTDIAIAVVLLWQLNQFKSVFRKTQRCILIVDDWPRSDDPRSLIYCCYLASFVGLWHPQSVLGR
jgi:hypothetical protein